MTTPGFDAAERQAILEEWQRQSAAWKPKDGQAPGCLMLLAAVILLVGIPKLAAAWSLPGWLKLVALVATVVLGIGGFITMQTRVLPGDPNRLIEDAIALLASGGGDATARRAAAVTLLFHYLDVRGPTMSIRFKIDDVAARLGASLGYVQDVERALIGAKLCDTVFTS